MYRTVALAVPSLTALSVSAYAADETTPLAATLTTRFEEAPPSARNVVWH